MGFIKAFTGFTVPGFKIEITTFEDGTTSEGVKFTIKSPFAWDSSLYAQNGQIAAERIIDRLYCKFHVRCDAMQCAGTGIEDDEHVFYIIYDAEHIYEI